MKESFDQREYGDYQTPPQFASDVCKYIKKYIGSNFDICIEPTCGTGNFVINGMKFFPNARHIAIEINPIYLDTLRKQINNTNFHIELINQDLFKLNFNNLLSNDDYSKNILVYGNLPWVNNSTLSVLNSNNIPQKINFKNLKGIEAITGSSNFDICEYMLLKLIKYFQNSRTTIVMLCKTIVAKNVFEELHRESIGFSFARVLLFDAKDIFNISASSCIFVVQLDCNSLPQNNCSVSNFENPENIIYQFGYLKNKFYSNLSKKIPIIDGKCCFEWRQGIKHDCAKIMELTQMPDGLYNGLREKVNIEETYVYPLIKSSKIKKCLICSTDKRVLVTQKHTNEKTEFIRYLAPLTWKYLNDHMEYFDARKSSIYRNSPEFSMFGIGDYSFSKYKVGISGFYKDPIFSLICSEKPCMMDDTCYFLGFNQYDEAYIVMLILNSRVVQDFIKSVAFLDTKRPYTKKVLSRIDIAKCLTAISYRELLITEKNLLLKPKLTEVMYKNFASLVNYKTEKIKLAI